MKRRAVFLDRDGVINEAEVWDGKPYPPSHPDRLVIVPNAGTSLAELKRQGFMLIVVTNQPDVRRGAVSLAQVQQLHSMLSAQLPLDDFFTCVHDDGDACHCRKPLPGLIEEAAIKYNIDTETSYLIGDRWRDIDAGNSAGCRTILINHCYKEREPQHPPDKVVLSLDEAVGWILQEEEKSAEFSF